MLLLLEQQPVTATVPTDTVLPQIVGTAKVDAVLVAQPGSWAGTPAPTFAWQWQKDDSGGGIDLSPEIGMAAALDDDFPIGDLVWPSETVTPSVFTNIPGETGATYVVKDADLGSNIRVVVTAINSAGVATATSPSVGPVAASDIAHRKAAYPVEIGWGQVTSGLFTFGVSSFGGPDEFAADSWSAGFAGPYDQVTIDAREFSIQRGRDTDLVTMRAGTANLTMRDPNGIYNPENTSSPIYGYSDTDKPLRISGRMVGGASFPLFYGFITDIQADPSARGHVVITAVDFLDKLDRQNPVFTLPTAPTDGAVIGAILDWMKWTDPAMRSLDQGDTLPGTYTKADGSQSGLALISDLLQSERGIVYVTAGGAVQYKSRNSRYITSSVATIDRVMTAFPVGRSNANIVNQWTVQRTDMAGNNIGTPQVWPDPASGFSPSQQKHGIIPQTLTTPYLLTDTQALNLAQFLVARTQWGLAYVYDVPINIPDAATLSQVLQRDLGDRVTMTLAPRTMPAFTADYYIEAISHDVTAQIGTRHTCTWRISAVNNAGSLTASAPFRFGISSFGGPDMLYY